MKKTLTTSEFQKSFASELQQELTLEQIRFEIWRNLPLWPSTFGHCSRCETGSARGGGICLDCRMLELCGRVGLLMATEYVNACRTVRRLEREMEQIIGGG